VLRWAERCAAVAPQGGIFSHSTAMMIPLWPPGVVSLRDGIGEARHGLSRAGFETTGRSLWWPDPIIADASKRGGSGLQLTNEQLCQLVTAIAADRDREAFAQLFRHFAPRLKGFGLRRGVDVGAAEELAQETMLTVWRKADTFDPGRATVSTWVFTIVRNKRIDLFRRESYPEADLSEASETPTEDRPPDESLSMSEVGRALRTAMKTLPKSEL
jgi:RNA polymerase sigma factor (sigma-70 family)